MDRKNLSDKLGLSCPFVTQTKTMSNNPAMNPWERLKRMVKKLCGEKRELKRKESSVGTMSSDVYKPLDWSLDRTSLDLIFNSLSIDRSQNPSSFETSVPKGSSELDEYYRRISNHQFEKEGIEFIPTRSLATLRRQKSKVKRPYKREGVVCERSSEDIEHVLPLASNLQQVGDRLVFKFNENLSDIAFSSDEDDW